MMVTTAGSSTFVLNMTEEERSQLSNVLEQVLRDKEVEIHRTDAFDYRDHLEHQEKVLRHLFDRLRRPASVEAKPTC